MFLRFDTEEAFDLWHEEIKQIKGIPHSGTNAKTGQIDNDKQPTENYSVLETDANGVLFCVIDDADLGLTLQSENTYEPVVSSSMN